MIMLMFLACGWLVACSTSQNKTTDTPLQPSKLSGETLAKQYCASCHEFPSPDLLDQQTWANGVLPNMALRLGMGNKMGYFSNLDYEEMMALSIANVFPDQAQMATEDWQKIVDYYVKNAPKTVLPQATKAKPATQLSLFKPTTFYTTAAPSLVTLVKIVPAQQQIYVGYRGDNRLVAMNTSGQIKETIPLNSPVADVWFDAHQQPFWLTMGQMDPSNLAQGKLQTLGTTHQVQTLLDTLRRPVACNHTDLNQDGVADFLVCQFGNEIGRLSWFDGKDHSEHLLSALPGARNTIVQDLNGDHLPDIAALMTQAQERIVWFINKGNGQFEEQTIMRFPPVYGSSFMQLLDFNHDGFTDILYTNGDNADLSFSLKRYHGVYLWLNNGKNQFTQTFFYPMFGASKALAQDFDLDGDLDIAAISFFTDTKQKPNEGFLYFENIGENHFKASTLPLFAQGRWMVMDAADADADGDTDLVLGSFSLHERQYQGNGKKAKQLSVVLLENRTK